MAFTKNAIVFIIFILFLIGCKSRDKSSSSHQIKMNNSNKSENIYSESLKNRIAELETQRDSLEKINIEATKRNLLLQKKNDFIIHITNRLNNIKDRLKLINDNSIVILKNSNDYESQRYLSKSSDELENYLINIENYFSQAHENVNTITNQISESDSELNNLVNELKESTVTIIELNNIIYNISEELTQKKELISLLQQRILSNERKIEDLINELNTAFYIADTRDNLIDNGIIHEVGNSFLGIGGKEVIVPGLSFLDNNFKKIDIRTNEFLRFNSHILELIPDRTEASRKIVNSNNKNYSLLHILDKNIFWQFKALVVVLEK